MQIFLIAMCSLEAVVILILLVAFIISTVKKGGSNGKISKQAELIVKGKLDVDDIPAEGNSDAAMTAKAFNSIKHNLMTFVESTKVNVVTLSNAIDELSASVDHNSEGNARMVQGANDVAAKTIEQLELVRDNLSLIDANNSSVQEIDSAMDSIKDILDKTMEISQSGINNLEGYEKEMGIMADDLNRINEILDKFNAEIKRISEVGDFVVDISNQLRLLAFNASIEAARAGVAGRGFTVVADEMSVMSTKTREGMQTIDEIVKEVMTSSRLVNESIANCENTYNKSKGTFNTVNSSFRSINESAMGIYDKIQEISGMFDDMTDNLDESKVKAENLYDTAQSISDSTKGMAEVSEEVAEESRKIGENAEALDGMLSGIRNLLKQFNTAIVPTDVKPNKQIKILAMSMLDNDFWYGVRKGVLYSQKEIDSRYAMIEYVPLIPREDMSLDDLQKVTVRSAIDRHFDGIVFPGFLGGANKEFKEAASKGIKLMAYNCDCAKEIPRVACLSPDPKEPGVLAAKATDKKLNGSGKVIMLVGDKSVGVNVERSEGFKSGLAGKNISIGAEMTVPDTDEGVYKMARTALTSCTDAKVIFLTNGFPLSVCKAIKDAGKVGSVSLVCFDHNPEIFQEVKRGTICAAIGQDAFGQGHDPIIWLYNNIVAKDKLDNFIPCRLSVVDKSNVDTLIET